jgi:hypothetical protein
VECIPMDPQHEESKSQLYEKFIKLTQVRKTE